METSRKVFDLIIISNYC